MISDKEAIEKIEQMAVDATEPQEIYDEDGGKHVFINGGMARHKIDALNPKLPDHILQTVRLNHPESFIDYINRYKQAETTLFASLTRNSATAVIDYHKPPQGDKTGDPDRQRHKAELDLPFDPNWKRWQEKDNQLMSQTDIVYFLEEMAHTIADPKGADLMEILEDLRVARNQTVSNKVNRKNGAVELEFRETDQSVNSKGDTVKIPDVITIVNPILFGFESEVVQAKFRYRMEGGKVHFAVSILNREIIEREAFEKVIKHIHDKTSVPYYFGSRA